MGEATAGEVGGRTTLRPRRLETLRTAWAKRTTAVAAAFALAVPLLGLTQVVAPRPALAAPDDPTCSAADNALPATESAREATAARAAARWFPADQLATATAVAGAESSWNPTAVNKAAGGNYGLWQINSVHAKLLKARTWRTPADNAWMAYQVWDAADGTTGDGQGSWRPWSAYNSGAYRAYLRDAVSTTATGDCVESGGSEIRVATWNVLKSNATKRISAGTQALTTQADVFGLQELGASSDRAAAARGADGFTMTTDRTAVPIFYRTDKYTALDQGRELAFSAGQKVAPRGSDDAKVTNAKWVTWVHLQDNATQETFYVVNTHLLVGAYNKGRSDDRRVSLYKRQLATLTSLTDDFSANGSAVYITCDCNVNYTTKADPIQTMDEHGLSPNWQHLDGKPTIGKKTRLDYVWSNRIPTAQVVGDKHGSDHASVVVTYPPTTGPAGSMVPVYGSDQQMIYSMRTLTDPSSGRTYLVPIPVGRAGKVLNAALDQVGDRWEFGGTGPDAWDCSGLTAAAWKAGKVTLPHQSEAQQRDVRNVALAKAQPGDIFWKQGYVSIYLGTVSGEKLAVGARKSTGAVAIETVADSDISAVLRPAG